MVYILLGTGFEEIEALTPVDLLRRAGVEVKTVGLNGKIVYGSHAIGVEADMTIEELDVSDAEMIVLPGGLGGVASIRGCEKALEAVKAVWAAGKYVAAICAGPTVLAELGLLTGKKALKNLRTHSTFGNSLYKFLNYLKANISFKQSEFNFSHAFLNIGGGQFTFISKSFKRI